MQLEKELAVLEASDKDLAQRDSSRLVYFLLLVHDYCWANQIKKMTFTTMNPDITFKVDKKKVYREVRKEGSCFREEHLSTPFFDMPIYSLNIKDNLEKVP
jgi:hypothetical protein